MSNSIRSEKLKNVKQSSKEKFPSEMNTNLKKEHNSALSNKKNSSYDDETEEKRSRRLKNLVLEKVYEPRNSLLTDLYANPHIKTIHSICVATFIIHIIDTLVYDYLDSGRINTGTRLITITFGKFHIVILIWICMQILSLLPFLCLQLWAKSRNALKFNGTILKMYDIVWVCIFIGNEIMLLSFGTLSILKYDLPIASTFIINIENLRFVMKIYAYVRTVSLRVLEKSDNVLPKFYNYIYFMFAPTMIYRDFYPRNTYTDWKKVSQHLIEMMGAIFFQSLLFERYFFTIDWKSLVSNSEPLEMKYFVQMLFQCMIPSLLFFMCGFYLLLHCWLNAWAEILRFADRRFYMDWWTQTNYAGYYRTWNVVVHDWLYTYIYKEIIQITKKRWIATLSVFTISALVHEFILIISFRFFYPVLLFSFGILSVLLVFITKNISSSIGNLLIWLTLLTGNGIQWLAYGTEYFARENCPQIIQNNFYDFIIPRSWSCQNIIISKS